VFKALEVAKLVAIAAVQGIVIGLCLGASIWLFLGVSVESPTVTKQPAPVTCKPPSSRLLLPFPEPPLSRCSTSPGASLSDLLPTSLYAKCRTRSVNPSMASEASHSAWKA